MEILPHFIASVSSSSLFSSHFLLLLPLPCCHLVMPRLPYVNLNYCHREWCHTTSTHGKTFLGTWQAKLFCLCVRVHVSPPQSGISHLICRYLFPPCLFLFLSLPLSLSPQGLRMDEQRCPLPPPLKVSPKSSHLLVVQSWVKHPWWPRPETSPLSAAGQALRLVPGWMQNSMGGNAAGSWGQVGMSGQRGS